MKPIASMGILIVYLTAIAYLIIVGFLGAIYGEPLGFLFMALGITASIPFIKGYKESK